LRAGTRHIPGFEVATAFNKPICKALPRLHMDAAP
jgi:hypothetical protein